jgi:hypothetical protein
MPLKVVTPSARIASMTGWPALFVLVTHLELLMAAAIRARFRDRPEDDWLALLGDRRKNVDQEWENLKAVRGCWLTPIC